MSNRSLPIIQHSPNSRGLNISAKTITQGSLVDAKNGSVYFCAQQGFSMNPTLCESDLLEIEAYIDSRPIRIGDVICFLPPAGYQPVVHRVVNVTPVGIRTKGDNASLVDPWAIQPDEVIGRVIRARRGKKRRIIYGGTVGRLWSCGLRGLKVLEHSLSYFYHRLARSGLLKFLIPIQKRTRVIAINKGDRRLFKLLLGNWLIGHYEPGMTQWQIQRPFRLFVDVKSLPR
jgi:hypothetical protein